MAHELLSVGIDVGTTTTQVICSRLTLENRSLLAVPDMHIVSKHIFFRSPVYFTPLTAHNTIDYGAVVALLEQAYDLAGITAQEVQTGALIITGETARKDNAATVGQELSAFAGDFVVATAGPALESVLAAHGAGAVARAEQTGGSVINFDIGGGTTNVAWYAGERLVCTFALDVGGRLLRFDERGTITYVSPRLARWLETQHMTLSPGMYGESRLIEQVAKGLAEVLVGTLTGEMPLGGECLIIGEDKPPVGTFTGEVMISGGVAACLYEDRPCTFAYGDMGPWLGRAVKVAMEAAGYPLSRPQETIRATVIGAGNHSLKLSGSTVHVSDVLPLKNCPIVTVRGSSVEAIREQLAIKLALYPERCPAMALQGLGVPSYATLKELAHMLAAELKALRPDEPYIFLLAEDYGKALGFALSQELGDYPLVCLDGIAARDGDYIDMARPVGHTVPVVVKTLIYES